MNRRGFLSLLGLAAAAPVAAKLPAERVIRMEPALAAPYGRSPAMTALEDLQMRNMRIINELCKIDPFPHIDWDRVCDEYKRIVDADA